MLLRTRVVLLHQCVYLGKLEGGMAVVQMGIPALKP